LHSNENPEASENRRYIEEGFYAAKRLIQWLCQQNAKNRYLLSVSRLPNEDWEEFSKTWYKELQTKFRSFLLNEELVETSSSRVIKLQEAIIPNFGSSDESKLAFYSLVRSLKGEHRVPKENHILNWVKHTGPADEIETWNHPIHFGLDDLFKEICTVESLQELDDKIMSECSAINWLNSVYEFLINEKKIELFAEHPIIPNQNGRLKKLPELRLEKQDEPIPDVILDLMLKITDDWRVNLIHRAIKLPGQNIEKKGLSEASREINSVINREEQNSNGFREKSFLRRDDALSVLIELIRNIEQESTQNDFRSKIFNKAKDLFKFEQDQQIVGSLNGFNFEVPLKLLLTLVNRKIEELGKVDDLSGEIGIPLNETIEWLNVYLLSLSDKENFKGFIEKDEIIPNKYGVFKSYGELKNYGLESESLDDKLLEILKAFDPQEDWKRNIVHHDIQLKLKSTYTFEELGTKIQEIVSMLIKEDAYDPSAGILEKNRDAFLDLINWTRRDSRTDKYLSLSTIREQSSEIFFKLTIRDSKLDIDDIKLLSDTDNRELLRTINDSSVSKKDIQELLSVVSDIGSTNELLRQAKKIKEEKDNFEFLLQIGTKVEDVVKEALDRSNLDMNTLHKGNGAFDIEIVNPINGKSYLLELKSYKESSPFPFRLAPSQAKRASLNEENYSIGILPRPENDSNINEYYVSNNLRFKKKFGHLLVQGLSDYNVLTEIKNRTSVVSILKSRVKSV
jgi:hypothetical protein